MTIQDKVAWILFDEVIRPQLQQIAKTIYPVGHLWYIQTDKAKEILRTAKSEYGLLPMDLNLELKSLAERLLLELQANLIPEEFENFKVEEDGKADWNEDEWKETNDIPTTAVRIN